ncbi:MAG TPA: DUF998 domain-containing protein [Devosia sp.]|jgi:hypothetical protein|nr:DUF998 domain-containing protein [Devosia sp.]
MTADILSASAESTRTLAGVAITGAIGFLVLLALLHVLRTDLAPTWHVISEYANGPHGWLMTIAFAALAVSCAGTVLAIWPHAEGWGARIGLVFVALAALGLGMAALFPADIVQDPMPPASWTGNMHAVASMLGNPTLMIGMVVLAFALPGFAPWTGAGPALLLFAFLSWICFIAMMVGLFVFLPQGTSGLAALVGLGNRLLVVAYAGWLVTANWPLLRG